MTGTTARVGGPRVAVHPRLRARRVAVRRGQGRRRLHRIVVLLAVVAVLAGLVALTRSPLLDVDGVAVSGSTNTPAEQITAVLGIEPGDAMTDLDLRAAAARVETLPWVRRATVSREWPNGVRVRVVERVPVAAVHAGAGRWFLLDAEGQVLAERMEGSAPVGIPAVLVNSVEPAAVVPGTVLAGVEGPLRVAGALTPDLAAWIDAIVPTERGVDVALVGGATAHLGDELDYAEELRALATVLLRVELSCLATIDVSAHTNPVVRRRC